MPSRKQWDDEESESSTPPSSPPLAATATRGRRQFDDEEDDSDVLDSWDAAEDSEVEREKARKAADAKAKADAEAAANKKSRSQRIAAHQAENARRRAELEDDSDLDEETEGERRERLRRTEQEADLRHAEDLFGDIGISNGRKNYVPGAAVALDASDPSSTVNLAELPLLNPNTKTQFEKMRTTLVPIIAANAKKAHYTMFLQEFAKQLAKDLPSDQIKKISSALTTLGNEKMKEEKAAQKGGKKTKAVKKKTVTVDRPNAEFDAFDAGNTGGGGYESDGFM